MATRFGRSHWQNADRLNLLKICLAHPDWTDRLREMRAIYANCPTGYFTENACREELERILNEPTPNLRVHASSTYTYSRKIMMTNWVQHFEAEISKDQKNQAELGMVTLRRNTKLIEELYNEDTPATRKEEIISMVHQNAEQRKNDGDYKRLIGSLETAVSEVLEKKNPTLEMGSLDLPPTKEPDADMDTGTKGYLTPVTSAQGYDFSFFSPPREMRTLVEAVREAVAIVQPDLDMDLDFNPSPPPPMVDEMPEVLEPSEEVAMEESPAEEIETEGKIKEEEKEERDDAEETMPTPKTSPRKQVSPKKANPAESPRKQAALVSPKSQPAPESPRKQVVTESPKKHVASEPTSVASGSSCIDDKSDALEEQESESVEMQEVPESSTKHVVPESQKKVAAPASPKKQTIPASPKKQAPPPSPKAVSQPVSPVKASLRSAAPKKKEPSPLKLNIEDIKKEESTPSPQESGQSSSEPVVPSSPVRTRGRPRLSSNASSTTKKNEEMLDNVKEEIPDPPSASARRRAHDRPQEPSTSSLSKNTRANRRNLEESPAPPLSRAESTIDLHPPSPYHVPTSEVEVQTDITIREAIQDIPMGERRRFQAVPTPRRARKSQGPGDTARSVSRASSVSTQGPRGGSVTRNPPRNAFVQTLAHFGMDEGELVSLRVEQSLKTLTPFTNFSGEAVTLNLDTCKEIEDENESLGNNRRESATRADGNQEVSVIVETSKPAGKWLVAEREFKLASNTSDTASAPGEYSPIKRRREDRAKEEKMKSDLLASHRKVFDHQLADAFRRPVPAFEEEYGFGILEKVDLSMIKREIDSGEIKDPMKLFHRCYRMLANAVMFNGYDHEVHLAAKRIHKDVMNTLIKSFNNERMPQSSRAVTQSRDSSQERDGPSGTPSVEPEPITLRGDGSTRVVSRRTQNRDGSLTANGNRRPKRNAK